ncbi:MAG: transposase [Gammaproteobacteria bacterium]|nr:transposase [Gammaproteobacteria bacterium]
MHHHTPNTIGVDISKAHLDAHELSTGRAAQFENNATGITKFGKWIPPDVDRVVYESTGPYHRALEETLAGTLPLARVNAAHARRFAHAMGQEAKTDAVDAKVLAKMGTALDVPLVEPRSTTQRDLAELQTARDALSRDRTAVLHRRDTARHRLLKRQLKLRLEQIERQIKALTAEIGKLIAADDVLSRRAEILTSIPGVAAVTAAALISEMPELGRLDAKAAASLAGLAPVTRESGKWKGRSFIRGGRWRARRSLFMAALFGHPDAAVRARKFFLLPFRVLHGSQSLSKPVISSQAAFRSKFSVAVSSTRTARMSEHREGASHLPDSGRLIPWAPSIQWTRRRCVGPSSNCHARSTCERPSFGPRTKATITFLRLQ